MHERGLYETQAELDHRIDVLAWLRDVVEQWIKKAAKHLEMSETDVEDARAAFYTFGSFRLAVHGPGAFCSLWFDNHVGSQNKRTGHSLIPFVNRLADHVQALAHVPRQ